MQLAEIRLPTSAATKQEINIKTLEQQIAKIVSFIDEPYDVKHFIACWDEEQAKYDMEYYYVGDPEPEEGSFIKDYEEMLDRIFKIIERNLEVALLSPSSYIRAIAEEIYRRQNEVR